MFVLAHIQWLSYYLCKMITLLQFFTILQPRISSQMSQLYTREWFTDWMYCIWNPIICAIAKHTRYKLPTIAITEIRMSSTASVPPTRKTAGVGLTCSSRISVSLLALTDFLSWAALLLTLWKNLFWLDDSVTQVYTCYSNKQDGHEETQQQNQ